MFPQPLHPAVVHLPMALVVLLPFAALAALFMIRRGSAPRTAWIWIVVLSVLLAGSSWLATETGEDQEEVVEDVVAEAAIHGHEEAAELFLLLSGAAIVVFGIGLARGRVGRIGRYAGLAATLVLLAAGYRVGHSGGALVYTHGAAQVYLNRGPEGRAKDAVTRGDAERGEDQAGRPEAASGSDDR